jgi:hypothetical protein
MVAPSRAALPFVAAAGIAGCAPEDDAIGMLRWPLSAICSVDVSGKGQKDVETDYLPHVITCENGAADSEALKAQAVTARSYMYYKVATSGGVKDGTGDQVYTCASKPQQKHLDAVKATSGQVIVWSGVVICSFFVAGAKPSAASCAASASDPDPTSTEKFVTYNEGKSGSQVTQSSLGWVSPTNKYNRGCMSQNGSHCLSLKGRPYREIVRFYYGADVELPIASGSCVTPPSPDSGPPPPKPDSGPPPPKPDAKPAAADATKPAGKDASPADRGSPPQPAQDWTAAGGGDGPPAWSGTPPPAALRGGCALGELDALDDPGARPWAGAALALEPPCGAARASKPRAPISSARDQDASAACGASATGRGCRDDAGAASAICGRATLIQRPARSRGGRAACGPPAGGARRRTACAGSRSRRRGGPPRRASAARSR